MAGWLGWRTCSLTAMASATSARYHACMIKFQAGKSSIASCMACITWCWSYNMLTVFTCSGYTVVTLITSAGYWRNRWEVIKSSRNPGTASVASIARSDGCHVTAWLPWPHIAIVASHAGFGLYANMIKACPQKTDCVGMTTFAGSISNEMVGRFKRSDDSAPNWVTSRAVSGCAFEHSAHMACFAFNVDMSTG